MGAELGLWSLDMGAWSEWVVRDVTKGKTRNSKIFVALKKVGRETLNVLY
jgi:hypothetical protein